MHQKILSFMIILLVLLQTPLISALMISLFIQFQLPLLTNNYDAARLLASGIAIGFGSIGPCIALARVAQSALAGIGINRKIFPKMVSFALITEAIIETPIIFSLIISLMLLFVVPPIQEGDIARVVAHIGATCCIGLGTLGAGLGSGLVAHKAAELVTTHSDQYGSIIRTSFFAQGLIETAVLYATLIAFFLLFST
jgi:F0F1-type ATP synthase membrane subunit c/vacuolar-type H+-ATPase subunit K